MQPASHLASAATADVSGDAEGLRRNVAWRVLPLVFLLYIVAYLERANAAFATLFLLTDRPCDARWLTPAEREYLQAKLDAEAQAKKAGGEITVWQALRLRNVWLLALGIFATNTGGYAFAFWLPTAIKGISGGSTSSTLGWSGLIYGCGLFSVFLSGQSSDRSGDHKWHCVTGQVFAALFLAASTVPGQPLWVVM